MGITNNEWKKIEDVVQRAISKELNEQFSDLDERIALSFASVKVQDMIRDSLTKVISTVVEEAIKKTKEAFDAQLSSMQASMKTLEKKINDLEQYDRRLNLIVHGVKESENEDCDKLILDILHNNVQVPIEPSAIQRCHRLGAVRRNGQCRPLIVRFVSYKTRREVL